MKHNEKQCAVWKHEHKYIENCHKQWFYKRTKCINHHKHIKKHMAGSEVLFYPEIELQRWLKWQIPWHLSQSLQIIVVYCWGRLKGYNMVCVTT